MATEAIQLKYKPENLEKRLLELGFKPKAEEHWISSNSRIYIVGHNIQREGEKCYILRLVKIDLHNDGKNEDLYGLREELEKSYKELLK